MKKYLFACVVALAVCAQANAACERERDNEVSVFYGWGGFNSFVGTVGLELGMIGASLGTIVPEKSSATGAIGMEFMHYTRNGRWAFGLAGAYERTSSVFKMKGSESETDCTLNFITVMPEAKLMWFNKDHVGMYSKLGIGAAVTIDSSKQDREKVKFLPAFQVSAVGIDFGGKVCRGFVEAGWGSQGLVLAGLRFAL